MTDAIERLRELLAKATPPGLKLCTHLADDGADDKCKCGYRGGVWTADGEHILFTMGEPVSEKFPGLEAPRIDRPTEIASARLLVAAYDALPGLLDTIDTLTAERDAAVKRAEELSALADREHDRWVREVIAAEADRDSHKARADERQRRATAAEERVRVLAEHVRELSDELDSEIEAKYAATKDHPSERRRYDRDIAPVVAARNTLSIKDAGDE